MLFGDYHYITSILHNLKQFNPLLESEHECPACPKGCDRASFKLSLLYTVTEIFLIMISC